MTFTYFVEVERDSPAGARCGSWTSAISLVNRHTWVAWNTNNTIARRWRQREQSSAISQFHEYLWQTPLSLAEAAVVWALHRWLLYVDPDHLLFSRPDAHMCSREVSLTPSDLFFDQETRHQPSLHSLEVSISPLAFTNMFQPSHHMNYGLRNPGASALPIAFHAYLLSGRIASLPKNTYRNP